MLLALAIVGLASGIAGFATDPSFAGNLLAETTGNVMAVMLGIYLVDKMSVLSENDRWRPYRNEAFSRIRAEIASAVREAEGVFELDLLPEAERRHPDDWAAIDRVLWVLDFFSLDHSECVHGSVSEQEFLEAARTFQPSTRDLASALVPLERNLIHGRASVAAVSALHRVTSDLPQVHPEARPTASGFHRWIRSVAVLDGLIESEDDGFLYSVLDGHMDMAVGLMNSKYRSRFEQRVSTKEGHREFNKEIEALIDRSAGD